MLSSRRQPMAAVPAFQSANGRSSRPGLGSEGLGNLARRFLIGWCREALGEGRRALPLPLPGSGPRCCLSISSGTLVLHAAGSSFSLRSELEEPLTKWLSNSFSLQSGTLRPRDVKNDRPAVTQMTYIEEKSQRDSTRESWRRNRKKPK
ncbi:uncharacterized protein LOC100619574 [Monodelphis domestica]|uniref:uncharacterized protein LOC100619574 n=1 Tax=Monodelphis domestica TaxID=13616 RepID=UPI0024E1AB5A|nr:uncharacterized protein LOC100619574 [Monodelphis domestica]